MNIRTTKKSVIVRYSDFRVSRKGGTQTQYGPADVHYSLAEFKKAAGHYGWGADASPTQTVAYMGDSVPMFEVLAGAMEPTKVVWL